MAQQYLRNVRVQIADGPTFDYDGEKNGGQGLRIRFGVRQKDVSTPNNADAIITNLRDSTTQPAFFTGKQITISVGYGSNLQTIFQGQIKQARNLREDVTDKILSILATDSGDARNFAVVNKTLNAGHTHMDRAQVAIDALKQLGVGQGYIDTDALSKIKFPRGFAAFGNAKDLLRQICGATGTSWSIQNGKVQILGNDKALPGGTIVLNGKSGLVGLPVQTIQGIEGVCLCNPAIKVGGLVQIDQKSIQQAQQQVGYQSEAQNNLLPEIATDGVYKIYVVEHEGDTRGNEYYTKFVGIKNGSLPTPALKTRLIAMPDQAAAGTGAGTGGTAPTTTPSATAPTTPQ
ncbi:hypothetical protein [Methylobacterium sp. 1030]|uniref:phage protein n=1 Tax=Methylobacterium sp. 1030 TaxID=3156404 RepID=UPI003391C405